MAQEPRRDRLVHGDGARAWPAVARSVRSCMVGPFVPAHRRAPHLRVVHVGSCAALRNVVDVGEAGSHGSASPTGAGNASVASSPLMRRRQFVKLAGLAAGSVVVGGAAAPQSPHQPPPTRKLVKGIEPFVDALPIPATMPITHRINGVAIYDVAMVPFKQQLHRDLAPTTLWGYHGACPGPTFEVRRGVPIRVLWRNALPSTHVLPIDTTIHGAEPDKPAVRTVVHVHGLRVLPNNDGYPDAWFTTDFARTGPFFKNRRSEER